MTTLWAMMLFFGAFAVSLGVIAGSVAPQWRRIARLAMGHVEEPFAPLSHLVRAERHIAVRRWASGPIPALLPAPASRARAAA